MISTIYPLLASSTYDRETHIQNQTNVITSRPITRLVGTEVCCDFKSVDEIKSSAPPPRLFPLVGLIIDSFGSERNRCGQARCTENLTETPVDQGAGLLGGAGC